MAEISNNHHREAITELKSGIDGYARFQDKLSAQISVDEAIESELAFKKGRCALRLVLGTEIGLMVLEYCFKGYDFLHWHKIFFDLNSSALLLAALVLRSWFHVPFAGRILFPVSVLLEFLETPPEWHPYAEDISLIFFLVGIVVPFIMGCLVDYGGATEPYRSHPRLRRVSLLMFGLLGAAISAWNSYQLSLPFFFFPLSDMTGFFACLWGWWPGQWIARRVSDRSEDIWLVLHGAWWRWGRRTGGRVLAVLFGLLPLFLFLNVLGVQERLVWPLNEAAQVLQGSKPVVTHWERDTSAPFWKKPGSELLAPGTVLWYWKMKGRWLEESDFDNPKPPLMIYGVSSSPDYPLLSDFYDHLKNQLEGSSTRDLSEALDLIGSDYKLDSFLVMKDAKAFGQLQKLLEPYRLRSAEQYNRLWAHAGEARSWRKMVVLERYRTRKTVFANEKHLAYVQIGLGVYTHTKELAEFVSKKYLYLSFPLLVIGLIGFAFVWRRGGDSPTGLWIGLMLLMISGAPLLKLSVYSLPAFNYAVWEKALTTPGHSLLAGLVGLLAIGQELNQRNPLGLGLEHLPLSAAWVYLCWPTRGGTRYAGWMTTGIKGVKILGVWIVLTLLFDVYIKLMGYFGKYIGKKAMDSEVSTLYIYLAAAAIVTFLLITICIIGFLVRRRTRNFSEISHLGTLPVAAWIALYISINIALSLMPSWGDSDIQLVFLGSPEGDMCFKWAYGLTWAALLLFASILVYQNFLRVFPANFLSFLLLTVLVPVLFEATEDWFSAQLKKTTFFSEDGAQLLGLLVIVMILAPLWEAMKHLIVMARSPTLHRIEKEVDEVLELLVELNEQDDRSAAVAQLLKKSEVEQYAFYERSMGGNFEILTGNGISQTQSLQLSNYLRQFLGGHRKFIDFAESPFEWDTFFHQFELHRIQKSTGYRYLLPLCLGRSVQGLLFLSDEKGAAAISKESFCGNLGNLGLAALYKSSNK